MAHIEVAGAVEPTSTAPTSPDPQRAPVSGSVTCSESADPWRYPPRRRRAGGTHDRTQANAGQDEYWNADEARHWVDEAGAYDRMLAPFASRLLEAAAIAVEDQVLDIGCGTGPTTCDAARAAANGHATGLDISRAMIEAARARASRDDLTNVSFEVGDAQTRRFDPGSVDVVMSRFGVMFFDDPVAAFANIRAALRAGGRLVFVCWQGQIANEWIAVPGLAAAQHVPLPTPGPPGAPGPFSFADADHVRNVLTGAGLPRRHRRPARRVPPARRRLLTRADDGLPPGTPAWAGRCSPMHRRTPPSRRWTRSPRRSSRS